MVASLQWQVFEEENKASVRLVAGDNVEISRNLDPRSLNQYTTVGNFLHCRCVYVCLARWILVEPCGTCDIAPMQLIQEIHIYFCIKDNYSNFFIVLGHSFSRAQWF